MMTDNKVYTIKMISGEEIVSRINKLEGMQELIKPRTVMVGQQGYGLAPWMVTAPDSNCIVSDQAIVAATETDKSVAQQYIKQTTGVDVGPPSGLILG